MSFDWSNMAVRFGAFALMTVAATVLGNLSDDLVVAGIAFAVGLVSLVLGTLWWRRGFKFPDTLQPHINVRSGPPNREFGIDLELHNPGRTDAFEVKIENIIGTKAPSAAVGAYPRWRGQNQDDRKVIRKDDSATLALCGWEHPEPSAITSAERAMVNVTVFASTGDTPTTLSPAATNLAGLDRYELVYQLRVMSDKTEKQAHYDVHVGPQSSADYNPQVRVVRRNEE